MNAVAAQRSSTTKDRHRRRRVNPQKVLLTVLVALVSVMFVVPAVWILIDSFRPNLEVQSSMLDVSWALFVPTDVTIQNYVVMLTERSFGRALANSAIVCGASVVVGLIISSMAAYPLAVYRFRGRNQIFAVVVVSFMVPFEAIAIPLSQQFHDWGIANSLVGLILPGLGNGLAIFNLRQAFMGIPRAYREAAMMDGASEPRILASLYVRMSGPALANSGLLIFLSQWTAYLWPLLIITDSDNQMAPIALAQTFGEHGANYSENFAGSVILSLLPAVGILLLQRVLGGLSIGSGEK